MWCSCVAATRRGLRLVLFEACVVTCVTSSSLKRLQPELLLRASSRRFIIHLSMFGISHLIIQHNT
jgi:hypothetical protein